MAISRVRDVVISPHFSVPGLVTDARQAPSGSDMSYYDSSNFEVQEVSLEESVPSDPPPPSAPSTFEIIEQQVRISDDGTSVVDITLDFPDVEGDVHVDVRVTKI